MYCDYGDADECYELEDTWTVEACGIELEVEAGTFTVCRQSAAVDWDETIVWIEWYDPRKGPAGQDAL